MQVQESILRTFITANDLHLWANQWGAPSLFPRLIRRLIHDTVERIDRIDFPADESVRRKGWDGYLIVEKGNAFVPDGRSGWELGTGHDVKRKANGDYEKRTAEPGEVIPAEDTFVFVTPRIWHGKKEWAAARLAENRWHDVRAYDAEDLAAWLEQAPRQHFWFSGLLGKHPEGIRVITTFWEEWWGATVLPVTPELMLAGRQAEVERIHQWVRDNPSVLAIQAESRKEALSFFAAAFQRLSADEREFQQSRAIVVKDASAWPQLVACSDSLILIPTFEDRDDVATAVKSNHHVMIPTGRDEAPSSDTLTLQRLQSGEAKKALLRAGFPEEDAEALATLARRSLLAFRRKLAANSEVQQPQWARPAEAGTLLLAILAGAWSDASAGDREVISRLAGRPYEEVNRAISRWANEPDPPVRRVGNAWLLVSREDSWSLLARFLTRADLDTFEEVVLHVLGEPDPSFDLPADSRWMVGVLGKPSQHTGFLREGLVETLAIMGSRSDSLTFADAASGQDRVDRIVRQLLSRGNADWRVWASISGYLPLLAEAAPEVFLEAVERGLTGDEPVLLKLFTENRDSFFGSSYHTGLLWALETLAWSPRHLSQSALVLAKLARMDPGGKLLNRPHNSLRDIFLFWRPHTSAGIEKRLGTLDAIRAREPRVAWPLLCSLLPELHSAVSPTATPRWREWAPDKRQEVTYGEIWEAARETVNRLLEDVGTDGRRWHDLISAISSLPPEQQDAIVRRLLEAEVESFTVEARIEITEALRDLISSHREFSDADWAMPAEVVDRLERVYERFEPVDPVLQRAWLFSRTPKPLEARSRDWRERHANLESARLEAIKELYAQGGLPLLIELALRIDRPEEAGFNLGKSDLLNEDEDSFLTQYLETAAAPQNIFARAFVGGRALSRGDDWVSTKLATTFASWSPEQRAAFFISLPFGQRTWDLLEGAGEEVQHLYWSAVPPYGLPPVEDCVRAVRELLNHGRPQAAVDLLPYYSGKGQPAVSGQLIAEALESLLRGEADFSRQNFGHEVSMLLDAIEASGEVEESRIAALEWAYLPLLEHYYRGPKVLLRELSRSPEFFVEVVRIVYKAEDEEREEATEESAAHARLGYTLLESWRRCPGVSDDGSVNGEALRDWVLNTRRLLNEEKRGGLGDSLIGKALAYAPPDPDGAWPHTAVRDLIEELDSEEIERGIEIGVFNKRGVVVRSPTGGGVPERNLADTYETYALSAGDRWPRTAAMLRRLASTYYDLARREDLNAELTEEVMTRERAVPLRVTSDRAGCEPKSVNTESSGAMLSELNAALDSLADGSDDRPVLPPEAFTRDSIYQDHD